MAKSKTKCKRTPKHVLKLPDLEQSKSAVLNSLTSQSSQRTYDHAIRESIEWYCSEPRLAFNKTVVRRDAAATLLSRLESEGSILLKHNFGGLDQYLDRVADLELKRIYTAAGDDAFNQILSNSDGDVGHDLTEKDLFNIACELVSC